jgi:hypothetical protein
MPYARTKEQVHELIDRMAPSQISAVVGLLETMLDPVSRAIANAPFDDEPVSDEEALDIAEARAACSRREVVSPRRSPGRVRTPTVSASGG